MTYLPASMAQPFCNPRNNPTFFFWKYHAKVSRSSPVPVHEGWPRSWRAANLNHVAHRYIWTTCPDQTIESRDFRFATYPGPPLPRCRRVPSKMLAKSLEPLEEYLVKHEPSPDGKVTHSLLSPCLGTLLLHGIVPWGGLGGGGAGWLMWA